MKVQHDFVSDRPPEELAELRLEAKGLRDYGVLFDPNNPSNFSLVTIWDDLEAAQRAADGTDLLPEDAIGKARQVGTGSLYVSPRQKGMGEQTAR
jgi:hypothetical protein